MKYMLGRNPARHDPRTLSFANYAAALPPAPEKANWLPFVHVPWGVLGNDKVGDCTCACMDHMEMVWTAAASDIVVPTTEDALGLYTAVTGYDPSDPSSDHGAVVLDVLKYVRQYGMPTPRGPRKIGAFARIDPTNHEHVKHAINDFGGIYLGVNLPEAWESAPSLWDVTTSKIAGGHAIPGFAYDTQYVKGVTIVTWGEMRLITWPAFDKYVEEAWAIISPDFLDGSKEAPSGFDLTALTADLNAIAEFPAQ